MDGAPEGNTGTGTMQITVLDINDNRPALEKDQVSDVREVQLADSFFLFFCGGGAGLEEIGCNNTVVFQYTGSIVENTAHKEVMRFTVLDDDQMRSDNWKAEFNIVSGNEDGIFSIRTDPKTNEGVLILVKVKMLKHSTHTVCTLNVQPLSSTTNFFACDFLQFL